MTDALNLCPLVANTNLNRAIATPTRKLQAYSINA